MTEQATLAMLIDELPSHAISGKERTEGYSINGIGTAMPEEYQDLDAMRLDTLRRNLCVAVGRTEDENWKVVIGAPNLAAGSFRLHVTHRMETVDDEGDIAFREETYALHYRAMRFDERAFLDTFPEASQYQPRKAGERAKASQPPVAFEAVVEWVRASPEQNSKIAWKQYKVAMGEACPKRDIFEQAWKVARPDARRGRPRKASAE
jgi:hypothetical protein